MLKRFADAVGLPVRDVRVPTRLQFQTTECGVAALAMVFAHHGRHVPTEELRAATGVSRDCVNAADMAGAARQYGFICKAYTREPDELFDIPRPFLAHLRFIHFVVVEGFSATEVLVNDPGVGRSRIPKEKFFEDFTGVVLTLTPGPDFVREGENRHPVVSLWGRLDPGTRRALIGAAGMGALATAILPLMAITLGGWVEALHMGHQAKNFWSIEGTSLVGAIGGLAVLYTLLLAGRHGTLNRLRAGIIAGQSRLLVQRFASFPASFFSYRLPDKLHEALYSSETVACIVGSDIAPGLLRLLALPCALAGIFWIAPGHGLAVGTLALGWIGAVAVTLRFHGDLYRVQRHQNDDHASALLFGRDELLTSKLGGKDDDFTVSRLAANAALQKTVQESEEVGAFLRAVGAGFFVAIVGVILLMSADLVQGGEASIGEVAALLVLTLAAVAPLPGVAGLLSAWDTLRHTLLPVEDLLGPPPVPPKADLPLPTDLSEDVALRATGLTFGYSATRAPLLRGVDLTLGRGEQLGLTGPSGGGKSTLASLLAGDSVPWSGRVESSDLAATPLGARVAWVNGSSFFFDGSVRDNLCLWSAAVDEERLRAAIRDACLEQVIAGRPDGLNSLVLQRGGNFSGGERQRMEIARALLFEPTIAVLDEAMDGLDPALEARIRANLRGRGCSLIIVSHRASTLATCDRVLHIAAGRIVEPGAVEVAIPVDQPEAPPGPPIIAASPEQDLLPKDSGALSAAVGRIATALGVKAPERVAGDAPTPPPDLAALARSHGMRVRSLRFVVPGWWLKNHGPLLAFRRDSGDAVVVTRSSWRSVDAIDPHTGDALPLDALRDLRRDAYRFYPLHSGAGLPVLLSLTRSLQESAREIASVVGLSLLVATFTMVLPLFAWHAFTSSPTDAPISSLVIGLAALTAAAALIEYGRSISLARAAGRVELSVMGVAVQPLTRLTPAFLNRVSHDEIARALTALSRLFSRLRGAPLRQGLDTLVILAGLALLSGVNGPLAFLVALLSSFAIAASAGLSRSARAIEPAYEIARRTSSRFLFDVLRGISRLRLLDSAAVALDRWRARQAGCLAQGEAVLKLGGRLDVLRESYPWLALALIAVMAPGSPAGAIGWAIPSALLIVWFVLEASLNLGQALVGVLGTTALRAQADLIATAPLETAGFSREGRSVALDLRDVTYRYPGSSTPALSGVRLRIEPGEFVAIAGPSGGGKSTLLRLLTGFDEPSDGAILLNGELRHGEAWPAWRRGVGLVSQDERVQSSTTLRRLIGGLTPRGVEPVWQAARVALLAEDIARMPMGLQTIVETGTISTGQEQRLLIARELLRQPSVLILDEATNAIPDAVQVRLFENLRRLGITCILVTHRESAIEQMDRVVVMEGGTVAWSGKPAELRREARLIGLLRDERQEGFL